jgi:hypothetical protein
MFYCSRSTECRFATRYESGSLAIKEHIADFALQKLVGSTDSKDLPLEAAGRFAAIATRIPLEFDATNSQASVWEQIQVEKHLRVCLAVRPGFTGAVTVSASEPILAEAARKAMRNMDAPAELVSALKLSGMDKGDRGEMVAMLLLNLAYDAARNELENGRPRMPFIPLTSFLRALLFAYDSSGVPEMLPVLARPGECKPLKDAFADAKVYFTHFIRVLDSKVIHRKYLPYFMQRGAAFICAVNQVGFDIGIPFSYRNESLQRRDMGLIFVQVKNDAKFSTSPHKYLFHVIDPKKLHIFSTHEEDPVPIIRMVFAFGAKGGCVVPVHPPSLRQPPRAIKKGEATAIDVVDVRAEDDAMDAGELALPHNHSQRPNLAQHQNDSFTAYDIWCGRACESTYAPIKTEQHKLLYNHLLRLDDPLRYAFDTDEENLDLANDMVSATRELFPCALGIEQHWSWGMKPEELYNSDQDEED